MKEVLAIPEERQTEPEATGAAVRQSSGPFIIGVSLVALGCVLLVRRIAPWFDDRVFWPVVLIGIGAALMLGGRDRGEAGGR